MNALSFYQNKIGIDYRMNYLINLFDLLLLVLLLSNKQSTVVSLVKIEGD